MVRRRYLATVPPQEIVPVIDGSFESSVKGIYVIGDVTGLPLVKVAANQGRDVIESMADSDAVRSDNQSDEPGLDLVIVGAGPAGISAAIEAHKRGWKYVLLERAQAASTVRSFPPGKKVYAEPRALQNNSELQVAEDLEKDAFLNSIQHAIATYGLNLKEHTDVAQVRRTGDRQFEVDTKSGKSFPCRNVVIAVGRPGAAAFAGCPRRRQDRQSDLPVPYRRRLRWKECAGCWRRQFGHRSSAHGSKSGTG